jgi:crotonobetainyl-CoA:carnitine CoA-transferase CaiB-like acyl-CoA transferase
MVHDPQMAHRKFYQPLFHPEIKNNRYRGVTPSFIISENPVEIKRAPLMGEQNETIAKEKLGLSDADIRQLILDEVLN